MSEIGTKVFGRKKDGTLSICRAKPEFRGTGRCNHYEHVSLTDEQINDGYVTKNNEDVLKEKYSSQKLRKNNPSRVPKQKNNKIQNTEDADVITREELLEGAKAVSDQITDSDWSFIQDFYNKFDERQMNEEQAQRFDSVVDNIKDYLSSDDDVASRVRGFLGKDINLDDFSSILVHQVGSMTKAESWRYAKRVSVKRIILSTLDNDMNKERYVASVLFFGGRCCYCNTALRKSPPSKKQATGEHITPISPENPDDIHGGTRYGNMALACLECNSSRGNKELVEWLSETKLIENKDKAAVLGRINAFRKFCLYSEYSRKENDYIVSQIRDIEDYVKSKKDRTGVFIDGAQEKIKAKIKIKLYDMKHLRGYANNSGEEVVDFE